MKQLLFLLLAATLTLCGCSEQDFAEIRAEQASTHAFPPLKSGRRQSTYKSQVFKALSPPLRIRTT